MSNASEEAKSKKPKDVEDYLSKIKLREVFQVIIFFTRMVVGYTIKIWDNSTHLVGFLQGLLLHVVQHQPEDPIGYFHEEITKIKKEMEETNVSLYLFNIKVSQAGP